jgi:hypothetical protein
VSDRRELRDRLNGAEHVVRVHQRHQRGVVADGLLERRRGDDPGRVHRHQGDPPPVARQRLDGIEHRFVLDAARNQAAPATRLQHFHRAPEGEVVGLGPAAREDHLGRLTADELGDRGARLVEQCLGLLAEVMHARRIAEIVQQRARHDLDDGRVGWRRGVVVEIGARHSGLGDWVIQ